jgi:hypothetical protein
MPSLWGLTTLAIKFFFFFNHVWGSILTLIILKILISYSLTLQSIRFMTGKTKSSTHYWWISFDNFISERSLKWGILLLSFNTICIGKVLMSILSDWMIIFEKWNLWKISTFMLSFSICNWIALASFLFFNDFWFIYVHYWIWMIFKNYFD